MTISAMQRSHLALASTLLLVSCSTGPKTASKAAAVAVGTDQIAEHLALALASSAGQRAVARLQTRSFADYYDSLGTATHQATDTKSPATTQPRATKQQYVDSAAPYLTHEAYWSAMAFDPATVTTAELKEALRMAEDLEQGRNGLTPEFYVQGGGLDTNWRVEGQAGLTNIFGEMIHNYHCGKKLLSITSRITGPVTAVCEAACLSFWETINKCKEVLKVGVEAERAFRETLPQNTAYTVVMDGVIYASEAGLRIAPTMEKIFGYVDFFQRNFMTHTPVSSDGPDEVDRQADAAADRLAEESGRAETSKAGASNRGR